jgi:two-component system cell cycle sensor histidine kinase/response regulator CckA
LELAQKRPPMLAVVDLGLPDMDGTELIAKLRELSEYTQVVVLTGNTSVESAVSAMREHSVDYLLKPLKVEQFLQVASSAAERWHRRIAEKKLRQADERLRRLVESEMLGIIFWDKTGAIQDANAAFLTMTGYTREDMEAGKINRTRMTPKEFEEQDRAKLLELATNGVVTPFEKEYIRKDGTRVPILLGGSIVDKEQGLGVSFVLDITDRKRFEKTLEARTRQQGAVASFGQRALVTEDFTTLLSEAAALVATTLEVPRSAVLEQRKDGSVALKAGWGWGSGDIGKVFETAGAALGAANGITVVIPGPSQAYGVLAAYDSREREFSQDDTHFLQAIAHILGAAIGRQVTEAAFRQAQRLEAVGRLAGGIAHDFNNMLTAITGYGEMIKMNLAGADPMREDVEEILKAAQRAAGLTRQLLAFSRQQVLQPRILRLNDIVTDMEGMVRRLIGADIELHVALDSDIYWVKADAGQVEQVILNLCVNARDAMPDGGRLTIETANIELDMSDSGEHSIRGPNEYVMLAVSDTGVGMDAEIKSRIFEPFFTTKSPDKGTGLGLATVHGIVKQSGGDIWVYSEPGHGTTFKIFLPKSTEIADDAKDDRARPKASRGTETVLLAEDEEAVRKLTQRVLERAGYNVLTAKDGPDAMRVAELHLGSARHRHGDAHDEWAAAGR